MTPFTEWLIWLTFIVSGTLFVVCCAVKYEKNVKSSH